MKHSHAAGYDRGISPISFLTPFNPLAFLEGDSRQRTLLGGQGVLLLTTYHSTQPPSRRGLLTPLVWLWVAITFWLGYEYLLLNGVRTHGPSLLRWMHDHRLFLTGSKLTPFPGDRLSWILGWVGFGLICLTNVYIWRKKKVAQGQKTNLTGWLDTHIFLGLLGPTLIVFHCNFTVRGLVSISFWSMVICFASGVVGRYFYVQLLKDRAGLKATLDVYEKGFLTILETAKTPIDPQRMAEAKSVAFRYAGGSQAMLRGKLTVLEVLMMSIAGDLRLLWGRPGLADGLPQALHQPLSEYALILRRFYAGKYFRRLMGYWHAFHKPFAIFMYVVTIIHIAAALIFRVKTS